MTQATPLFGSIFSLLVQHPLISIHRLNLTFVASAYPEIIGGSKFKSRSYDLLHTPFGPFLLSFVQNSVASIHLQNLNFVASAYPEIILGPKFKSRSHDLSYAPFAQFCIFCLLPLPSIHLQNLRFVSSAYPLIIRGFRNSEVGHMTQITPLLAQFCILFSIPYPYPLVFRLQNLKFVALAFPQIIGEHNSKVRHVTQATPPFHPVLFIFCLVSLTFNPPARLEVCNFSLSRDNRGAKI